MDETPSLLSHDDVWQFNEGTHSRLYEKLGAHVVPNRGTCFVVWAPNAEHVTVVGSFNGWNRHAHSLTRVGESGLWSTFVSQAGPGDLYKYFIRSRYGQREMEKADPVAFYAETPPRTASIVWDLGYEWSDGEWMECRKYRPILNSPLSIYEVHLASWRRRADEGNRLLTYRELAKELAEHVKRMGFTHVQFLPVMEHPRLDSWGYKVNGYFCAGSRLGTPQDLMYLIDTLHQHEIGVIIDWPGAHFAVEDHGLAQFDGTHLYDHCDELRGYHPQWCTRIFNYGRNEVRSFLLSSATFWLDKYHADGLRIDAVSSMLYRDFARLEGPWVPNLEGGKEDWEAASFLKKLNALVHADFPGSVSIAEETTDWPLVTRDSKDGGLGFDFKWDMTWTYDALRYLSRDPIFRSQHHDEITYRMLYHSYENFLLGVCHDEVANGEQSLLGRIPGQDCQKFANIRLLYGFMYAQPGKKLLFMGCEFAQREEWCCDRGLSWEQFDSLPHSGVARWVQDLNRFYRGEPALFETDYDKMGFEWIDWRDRDQSVLAFLRRSKDTQSMVLAVFNFTPIVRQQYRIGVPAPGFWHEALNSDSQYYGGGNCGNAGGVCTGDSGYHGHQHSIAITLPPLAALIFKHVP